jgi:hypothetical protein
MEFLKNVWAKELKAADQLPDIDADKIVISLREEGKNIVLYYQNKEIWREVLTFEYYPRYLELGNILKEKIDLFMRYS